MRAAQQGSAVGVNGVLGLLVVAWGQVASVTALPWFAHSGWWQIIVWIEEPLLDPTFLMVIGVYGAGVFAPLVAAVGLWRGRRVVACSALMTVASAWLFWQLYAFAHTGWVMRLAPISVLSLATLGVAIVNTFGVAHREVG
jgi:hypothetical protein